MNEQLETAVVNLINKSVSGVESSISFLEAEIPEVIQQLLTWTLVNSLITGLICLLITLVWFYWGIYKPIKTIRYGLENKVNTFFTCKHNGLKETSIPFIMNVFICIPFHGFVYNLGTTLKIWIAPKVWLLEYAASLVK